MKEGCGADFIAYAKVLQILLSLFCSNMFNKR